MREDIGLHKFPGRPVWMGGTLVAFLVAAGLAGGQAAAVDVTLSLVSPGSRPNAFHASVDDLKAHGFVEQEYFIAGTAEGKGKPDDAVSSQAYKTRLLVRRPADPKRFNGAVLVEWLNVVLGYDLELGWPMFGDLMMRDGYAWVGISAQPVGIDYLKKWDPQRYGSLMHPAGTVPPSPSTISRFIENYSDAIFTQTAMALRRPGAVDPLGGFKAQRVLAFGSAGSAIRLKPYINNLAAGGGPYDGYFVHATAGAGKLRENLDVPVFYLNSEWEMPAYFTIRQPDSRFFRYWEVPGSGHIARLAEDTLIRQSRRDDQGDVWSRNCDFERAVMSIEYASRAALHHLNEWVKTGKEPPHAPLASMEPSTTQPTLVRDQHRNALGGVRLPYLEVPTGRHIGQGTPSDNRVCSLTAGYAQFGAATLASLYPTHAAYVSGVDQAAERAVKAGYVLPADRQAIRAGAGASDIGKKPRER